MNIELRTIDDTNKDEVVLLETGEIDGDEVIAVLKL